MRRGRGIGWTGEEDNILCDLIAANASDTLMRARLAVSGSNQNADFEIAKKSRKAKMIPRDQPKSARKGNFRSGREGSSARDVKPP